MAAEARYLSALLAKIAAPVGKASSMVHQLLGRIDPMICGNQDLGGALQRDNRVSCPKKPQYGENLSFHQGLTNSCHNGILTTAFSIIRH